MTSTRRGRNANFFVFQITVENGVYMKVNVENLDHANTTVHPNGTTLSKEEKTEAYNKKVQQHAGNGWDAAPRQNKGPTQSTATKGAWPNYSSTLGWNNGDGKSQPWKEALGDDRQWAPSGGASDSQQPVPRWDNAAAWRSR